MKQTVNKDALMDFLLFIDNNTYYRYNERHWESTEEVIGRNELIERYEHHLNGIADHENDHP